MRWGRNAWVIVSRLREQRFVRYGAGLLAAGFCCQFAGYLSDESSTAGMVGVVAVSAAGVVAVVLLARRLAGRGLPRYVEGRPLETTIHDQRDIYQVGTVDDVRRFWAIGAGRPLEQTNDVLKAYVSHGRWVADCARCNGGTVAWIENPDAACLDCGAIARVEFPPDHGEIEAILLARPNPANRNWRTNDLVAQLLDENREHKLPQRLFVDGEPAG